MRNEITTHFQLALAKMIPLQFNNTSYEGLYQAVGNDQSKMKTELIDPAPLCNVIKDLISLNFN